MPPGRERRGIEGVERGRKDAGRGGGMGGESGGNGRGRKGRGGLGIDLPHLLGRLDATVLTHRSAVPTLKSKCVDNVCDTEQSV